MGLQPSGTTSGVKVVLVPGGDLFAENCGVHEAVGWVCGHGHQSAKVVDQHGVGACPAGIFACLPFLPCFPQIFLDGLDERVDPFLLIQFAADMAHHQGDVDVLDCHMLLIQKKNVENGSGVAGHIKRCPLGSEGGFGDEACEVCEGDVLHVRVSHGKAKWMSL